MKLGIKSKNEDGLMGIPEQHVAASRPYFAPEMSPVSQEERIRPLGPREQPQKIRSSFIVARAPSLHHVHSDEVLQSYQGSVREPTPEVEVEHVEDPYGTVSTCNSLAWKSTLSSRTSTIRGPPAALEKPPLESIFERDLQTPCPPEGQERINAPRHRKDRYHVDVRRLYSALVKNLDEKPPVLKPIPPKIQDTSIVNSPSDQHDHHAFQTYRTALNPVSTLEKTGSDVVRRSSRVTFEEPPRRTPPPIPQRPSNYQRRKPTGQADADAYDHSESSDAPLAKQEGPQHATPVKKSRTRVSFAAPKSATCGVLKGDDSLNRTDNVRDHVTSTEINATPETKLPDWNHPFLGKSPSFTIASNVGAWKSRMQPYSPTTPVHRYMAFESPIADAASMIRNDHFGIIRSKSVVESPYKSPYNREETRTPLQRTQTAFGFRKTGNTMGELDISAAVRAQFGPVAGDEGEYDEQDFEGWMNRSYLG